MKRFGINAAISALCLGLLACSQTQLREEFYGDGSRRSQTAFVRKPDAALLRHGVQTTWYPGGEKESMETYVNGYRQGYAFRWHPNGRLKALEHYTDGLRDGQAKFWDGEGNLVACFTPDAADCLRPSAVENALPSQLAARP